MMDKNAAFSVLFSRDGGRNIPDAHRRRELIYVFRMYIDLSLWPVCCPSRLRRNHVFIALQLFKNLADETRLGIVLLLKARGELCVCDLCTALAQSQPKISRHLAAP